MRRDLPGRRPLGVQHAGRRPMQHHPLGAVQRRLDRLAHDRMQEARRVGLGQHVRAHQRRGRAQRLLRALGGQRRRMAQDAAITQHGQGLSQPGRGRAELPQPRADIEHDVLRPRGRRFLPVRRGRRGGADGDCPEQFPQVKRVTPAGAFQPCAALRTGLRPERLTGERSDRVLAEQPGPHYHRGPSAHREQRGRICGRIGRPQCDQQRHPQVLGPGRQVGQPPQRGAIGPVRIVHGHHHRLQRGEVRHQPVQAVQHREGRIRRFGGRGRTQQGPRRLGRPRQQQLTFLRRCAGQPTLEQLPDHPEPEPRLQLGPPRPQHRQAPLPSARAGHIHQRGLPDPRAALDDQNPAGRQQLLHRRQLLIAFEQHGLNLIPPPEQPHKINSGRTGGSGPVAGPAGRTCHRG